MPLTPLSGMYDADDLAAMTAVLEELTDKVAANGLSSDARQAVRASIAKLIIDVQSRQRLEPEELRAAVVARLDERARREARSADRA